MQVGAEEFQRVAEEVQVGTDQFNGQNVQGGQAAGSELPAGTQVMCEQTGVTEGW